MIRQVVLVGLSGSGKSSVGREVATLLGWTLIDTDAEIERRSGRTIPDVFRDEGETRFREIETEVLADALSGSQVVIATGGGAVIRSEVWADQLLGAADSLTVWLDGDPATLANRLVAQARVNGAAADRPLLADGDPVERLTAMRSARAAAYAHAKVTLDVTARGAGQVAADVVELVRLGLGEESLVSLQVEGAHSDIHVGTGARFRLADIIGQRWPSARHLWIAVDGNVVPHAEATIEALRARVRATVHVSPVGPGESSKSVAGLSGLYDWMLNGGVERGDVVVAIGGGMVGDLAGFAAATVLRGIGLVQVPTTLLAMVDSSVGGKTGINHPAGKNLIGAFYQPPEVVIDPELLVTLPERELRSGWAEIIKHAVIEPSTPNGLPAVLFNVLERNTPALSTSRGTSALLPWVVRRNVALKAGVVAADEREAGLRAILNFGHTIGHGIEAAGYSLLHGEAVAVGMCAALDISHELHLIDGALLERVRTLIEAFELPVRASVDPVEVKARMTADKKRADGRQQWILPVREGGVVVTTDVPAAVVDRAIAAVTSPV